MDFKKIVGGLVLLTLVNPVRAVGPDTVPTEMGIARFLSRAATHDTRFAALMAEKLDWKYREALRLPAADWIVSVLADYTLDLEETGVLVNLDKLIPLTGTSLGASVSGDDLGGADSRAWSLSIGQDLARNAFGSASRLDARLAGKEVDLARYQLVEAWEDYLAQLSVEYVRWYLASENHSTAVNSAAEGEKLLLNIRARKRRNIAEQVDVDKLMVEVLDRRESVIRLAAEVDQLEKGIRRAMAMEESAGDLVPLDPSGHFQWQSENIEAFDRDSRTSAMVNTLQQLEEGEAELLADDLLPALRLGASWDGSRAGSADPASDLRAFLKLDFPLGLQKEKARLGTAKAKVEKTRLTSKDRLERAASDLRGLDLRIQAEDKRLDMVREKIRLGKSILLDENENYSFGRTSLNDLIRFVNALENNRFDEINRVAQRTLLVIEALRLSDRLVADNGVE